MITMKSDQLVDALLPVQSRPTHAAAAAQHQSQILCGILCKDKVGEAPVSSGLLA